MRRADDSENSAINEAAQEVMDLLYSKDGGEHAGVAIGACMDVIYNIARQSPDFSTDRQEIIRIFIMTMFRDSGAQVEVINAPETPHTIN